MGTPKKNNKRERAQAQMRPRTTRSSKGRLLSDPLQNTALLTEQLRSLGLYAAPTVGDGNCLFRALSDQLYGSPSRHAQLRADVCDWIARHEARYEPFVEDERGLEVHLRCMRENATYGGHMELSAFAHLTRRNVKVIQPGLVYVIEWAAGSSGAADSPPPSPTHATHAHDDSLDERERRRLRRDRRKDKDKDKERPTEVIDVDAEEAADTIYVAYHDWEHFSSIRNLKGPHTGLPAVRETPPYPQPPSPLTPSPEPTPAPAPKKKVVPKVRLKLSSASPTKALSSASAAGSSRALAPASRGSRSEDLAIDGAGLAPPPRVQRSPKRSFDESSGSAGSESESVAKRTRSAYAAPSRVRHTAEEEEEEEADDDMDSDADADGEDDLDVDVDAEGEEEGETRSSGGTSGTSLSLSLSPPALSSSSSLSSLSSVSPSPPPEPIPAPAPVPVQEKSLTRRQRKALGLPKARSGAGKIVIPGGRFEGTAEWRQNGVGRLDVRGFRELKI
ncbi:hypothetical protein B0H10DRAFT_1077302 [Mycena sp. CBHHK59/15]|nr:hypothetical protein B0H10DRAFT_1077302 [Mycena sp. CBHHK59/15]